MIYSLVFGDRPLDIIFDSDVIRVFESFFDTCSLGESSDVICVFENFFDTCF